MSLKCNSQWEFWRRSTGSHLIASLNLEVNFNYKLSIRPKSCPRFEQHSVHLVPVVTGKGRVHFPESGNFPGISWQERINTQILRISSKFFKNFITHTPVEARIASQTRRVSLRFSMIANHWLNQIEIRFDSVWLNHWQWLWSYY